MSSAQSHYKYRAVGLIQYQCNFRNSGDHKKRKINFVTQNLISTKGILSPTVRGPVNVSLILKLALNRNKSLN